LNVQDPAGIPLHIADGLAGHAIGCDAGRLRFVSPKSFPPGQPLALTLQPSAAAPLPLTARCVGSKRRDDGLFDVRARLINLDRATREALAEAFTALSPAR
jgi:hypothetical protein